MLCALTACALQFPGTPARSVEDLKSRYYFIARKLLVAREGGEAGVAHMTLVGGTPGSGVGVGGVVGSRAEKG